MSPPFAPPAGFASCPRCLATYPAGTAHTCSAPPADSPTIRQDADALLPSGSRSGPATLSITPDVGPNGPSEATPPAATPPAGPDPLIGQTIGQRYQILAQIGHGGMGVVYKARHIALDSMVAVKILLRPQSDRDRDDLLREAQLASKALHPNVVHVMDVGLLDDGRPYLVMEYLEGETIGQVLRQGPVGLLRACRLAIQIARGMQAIHSKGIVHRDLKPDNIFLLRHNGSSDFVKIVDFGIAKELGLGAKIGELEEAATKGTLAQVLSRTHATGTGLRAGEPIVGTPLYMAPEQVRGRRLDGRCDQYSLGCILYQLLTGQPPFRAESAIETMFMRLLQAPISPRQRCPERMISEELEATTLRCLALAPEERFGSMDELAVALEREEQILNIEQGQRRALGRLSPDSLPVESLPSKTARVGQARQWLTNLSRRQRLLGGAVLLVVLMVLGGLLLRGRRDHYSPEELRAIEQRAVAVLVEALGKASSDGDDQARALAGLAETHDVRLRTTIESALRSPSEEVQAQAAAALGALGATASLTRLADVYLSSSVARVRLAAARSLDQLGDARGTRYLREALTAADEETRIRAGLLLCERTDATAVSMLQILVEAGTLPPQLLLSGLLCLARAGSEPAQQRLVALLSGGESRDLQLGAAARLLQLGDARGRPLLREVAGRRGSQQLLAARLLAAADEPEIAGTFRAVADSSEASPEAQLLAAEGLGLSGQLEDLAILEPRLSARTPPKLRLASAAAIIQIVHRDSTLLIATTAEWSRAALDDPNWTIRQGAATVLGDSPGADALALLARAMKDHETRVRKSGARALGRRLERDALQVLHGALADSEVDVRREALRSLGKITKTVPTTDRGPVRTTVTPWLTPLLQSSSRPEQILARGVFLLLGDDAQAAQLRTMAVGAPEDVRILVAEQLESAPQELASFLSDGALMVRLTAARLLALHGDRRGMSVLSEALAQGGTAAQLAIAAIGRLGGKVQLNREAVSLLSRGTLEERLAVVAAWGTLPAEQGAPLLERAAHNGEQQVRMQVVEALGDLPSGPTGIGNPAWIGLLRLLTRDADAVVRARASAVLGRALRAFANPNSAGETARRNDSEHTNQEPAATTPATALPANAGPTDNASAQTAAARGSLLITSQRPLLFQIDQRAWQRTDGRVVALDAGLHKVVSLSGIKPVDIRSNQTTTLALSESAAEEAERQGQAALSAKDYRKAQKFFDRARLVCAKSVAAAGCALLGFDIALKMGQVYEAQSRFSEAMTEYQSAAQLAPQVRGQKESKSLFQAAIARLETRLGKVVLSKGTKGKCRAQTLWMPIGTHTLVVAGSSKTIKVTAGQTVQIGSCN